MAAKLSADALPAWSYLNPADRLVRCYGRPPSLLPARAWLPAGRALRENRHCNVRLGSEYELDRLESVPAEFPNELPRSSRRHFSNRLLRTRSHLRRLQPPSHFHPVTADVWFA